MTGPRPKVGGLIVISIMIAGIGAWTALQGVLVVIAAVQNAAVNGPLRTGIAIAGALVLLVFLGLVGLGIGIQEVDEALVRRRNARQGHREPSKPSPARARYEARVKEFFSDLREDVPGGKGLFGTIVGFFAGKVGLADINSLPAETRDGIIPFLPAGTRYISQEQLQALLSAATRLLAERAAYARQEADAIEQQTRLEQARARAAFLRALSSEQRALIEIGLSKANPAPGATLRRLRLAEEFRALLREFDRPEEPPSGLR